MRPLSRSAAAGRLGLFCTAAAVGKDRSRLIYVDSGARAELGLPEGSMHPLWLVFERAEDCSEPPWIQPLADAVDRISELRDMTKAELAALVQERTGEAVDVKKLKEDQLVMLVLATEDQWVDLTRADS